MFLRQRMDENGYVYLSVVANFNRMRQSASNMSLKELVVIVDTSSRLEVLCKRDEISGKLDAAHLPLAKIRVKHAWSQWVLPNSLPTRHPFEKLRHEKSHHRNFSYMKTGA